MVQSQAEYFPNTQRPPQGLNAGAASQVAPTRTRSRSYVIPCSPMPQAFYRWTRDLHLYFGLFLSPFLIVFAVSVFFMNHVHLDTSESESTTATFRDLQIPAGIEQAESMERVQLIAPILSQVGASGEVNYIRFLREEHRLVIPVVKPGVETTIDLNIEKRTATVSIRRTAFWERLAYLHRSPGPHNVAIRGNWFWTRAWTSFAAATVYLIFFLSVSGLYLWTVLRSERRVGLILLASGALTFCGMVYAVVY